ALETVRHKNFNRFVVYLRFQYRAFIYWHLLPVYPLQTYCSQRIVIPIQVVIAEYFVKPARGQKLFLRFKCRLVVALNGYKKVLPKLLAIAQVDIIKAFFKIIS